MFRGEPKIKKEQEDKQLSDASSKSITEWKCVLDSQLIPIDIIGKMIISTISLIILKTNAVDRKAIINYISNMFRFEF